jgi:hypothetical protein
MPSIQSLPWARIALAALLVAALIRAGALVRHEPLLAYANSYDQIRYSSCLDLAPWRPGVAADRANVAAPYSRFAFQPLPAGWCVPSSDLVFTAPVALAWRAAEALGGRDVHSVRRLGELRLIAWLVAAAWATRVFVRARRVDVALAHAAWLLFVAADPGITLYLSTFYAEPTAAFGLYLCGVGAVAAMLAPERRRVAIGLIAIGALLLATSKFQHLGLPLVLAIALLAGAGRVARSAALALLVAGAIGVVADVAIAARNTPAARSIAMNNRADFVMSVLLPATSDVARMRAALSIDDTCASYAGKSVYSMPGPVEATCPTIAMWHSATLWWLLVSDPPALARALAHIPQRMLPWQPRYLGVVEDADHGALPASMPTLLGASASPSLAYVLLVLPWLVAIGAFASTRRSCATGFALACAAGSASVVVVALFGDGDVEFAKHAHLAAVLAVSSLAVPLAAAIRRVVDARGERLVVDAHR